MVRRDRRFEEVVNFRMPKGSRKRLNALLKKGETQGMLLRAVVLNFMAERESIAATAKEKHR